MNARTVIAKANMNDSQLNHMSTEWKRNTACQNNPVVDVYHAQKALYKTIAWIFGVILGIGLYIYIVPEMDQEFTWEELVWWMSVVLIVASAVMAALTHLRAEWPRRNAKSFIQTLSVIEHHLDYTNDGGDLTFWNLGDYDEIKWRRVAREILKPMTDAVKGRERFAWHQETAKKLKKEFETTHSRLVWVGLADRNRDIYWQ